MEGIIVVLLMAVNLALCVREEKLKRTEMVRSVQDLLNNYDGEKRRICLVRDFYWLCNHVFMCNVQSGVRLALKMQIF